MQTQRFLTNNDVRLLTLMHTPIAPMLTKLLEMEIASTLREAAFAEMFITGINLKPVVSVG